MSASNSLLVKGKEFYTRLTKPQRWAIIIAAGVLAVVGLGSIGTRSGPKTSPSSDFKPYRPERQIAARVDPIAPVGIVKEGEFPRPPGPRLEVNILEEIKSVKGTIEDLRSSVVAMSEEAKASSKEERLDSEVSLLRTEVKKISSGIRDIREKLKRDEQALKEQSPIDLIAILTAGGFNYAILRTEAGEKRVTEGDKVGPWMVEEINGNGREVRLSNSNQKRILAVK